MTELEIKTLELEPAKIEFNKQQIEDELKETLKKYEGLVFTEDNTAEIRKVLAELRKGKTASDNFRKEKNKEVSAPITEFENEVKSIVKMFDDVINPINEQLKEFEEKRKQEKLEEIETIITETIKKFGLESKFANQLDVDEQYLNKSFSINQAKETIEFRANNLLNEQKLEIMNRENIESFVKLKNSEHELNMSVVSYLSQLEFKDVADVKKTVEEDVQAELNRRSKEEAEKKAKEELTKEVVHEAPTEPEVIKQVDVIDDLPFGNIDESQTEDYTITVTATSDEIDLLEEFLRDNKIKYQTVVK